MSVVGIITARGGSKGVPRKSIRPLAGKPLMAWTIEAGLESQLLDRVVLSTDDVEMADVGRKWGAEVLFLRPPELALDTTPTLPVLQHAVRFLEEHEGYRPEAVITLQPTSPLRRAEHIDQAISLLRQTGCDSVVSLRSVKEHPYWLKRMTADRVFPYEPSAPEVTRRQDLPPVFALNGAVFVTRRDVLMEQAAILGSDTRGFVMDDISSVDIDAPLDLRLAEMLLQEKE